MNFLFWNTNRKPNQERLVSMCHEHQVDVLVLAEFEGTVAGLANALNQGRAGKPQYFQPFGFSRKLAFLIRYFPDSMEPISDEPGIAVRALTPPIGQEIIIVAVHFPSKLYRSNEDQLSYATEVSDQILEGEGKRGHDRVLLLGDLNMDPFDSGTVSPYGQHAVMDRNIAKRTSRKVDGRKRKFFYNPMWSRLGDASAGPQGPSFFKGVRRRIFGTLLIKYCCVPVFYRSSATMVSLL